MLDKVIRREAIYIDRIRSTSHLRILPGAWSLLFCFPYHSHFYHFFLCSTRACPRPLHVCYHDVFSTSLNSSDQLCVVLFSFGLLSFITVLAIIDVFSIDILFVAILVTSIFVTKESGLCSPTACLIAVCSGERNFQHRACFSEEPTTEYS